MQPRAAYVHVPFCTWRCGYCNFSVVAGHDNLIDPYLQAIEIELRGHGSPWAVDTLFIGGGTPTCLPVDKLEHLLKLVLTWFPLAPGGEATVEANPADLDDPVAKLLADYGMTRISLGAQSFDDAKLKTLERDHAPADIERAFDAARRHVGAVAMDLIFATPGESTEAWKSDLTAGLALGPDHFSIYSLTFEKGTTFWGRRTRGELVEVDEETQRAMYETAVDRLVAAGYEHYEVSNFARPGHRCRHNEVYWTGGEYFAVGPGAARHVDRRRETNHRSTATYIRRVLSGRSPVAESEMLGSEDKMRERLVFALRRLEGVDLDEFKRQTGFAVENLVGPPMRRHVEAGRLVLDQGRLRLSRQGLLVSDSIWTDFLRC